MNHDDMIKRLATITDDDAARMVTPETRAELAEQIMTTAPARSRRRALAVGVPIVAAAATAAVLTTILPAHRTHDVRLAALSFTTQGKYLVVKVTDPYADPKRYAREFAAHGMKVALTIVPVSPSLVGSIVFMGGGNGIKTINERGKCWTYESGPSCPVGVKIPIGFRGDAVITFGRAARPGEKYGSTRSAFTPGEGLHCVDIRRRTVDQARALIKRAHMSVASYRYELRPGWFDALPNPRRDPGTVPGKWYVSDAIPWAPGQVLLFVGAKKPRSDEYGKYYEQMFKNCPRRS